MRPGASGSPGITNSSPVKNSPSLILRKTGRVLMPTEAASLAEDRAQDIVELVRDAAGESPDRLHLLHLQELGGQILIRRSGRRGLLEGARVLDQEAERLPQNRERSRVG